MQGRRDDLVEDGFRTSDECETECWIVDGSVIVFRILMGGERASKERTFEGRGGFLLGRLLFDGLEENRYNGGDVRIKILLEVARG